MGTGMGLTSREVGPVSQSTCLTTCASTSTVSLRVYVSRWFE
eukprot:gene5495-7187_t